MSEPTVAAVVGDVEKALTPETEAALKDVHTVATAELDHLREQAPQLQQEAGSHLQSLVDDLIGRYHHVVEAIEQKLGIAPVPAAPTVPASSSTETVSSSPASSPASAAPSTTAEASSPTSSDTSASAPAAEAPAAS
jgi:ElaB/YqjD/DUF883 family membrane-anchored ribosome-binding protein